VVVERNKKPLVKITRTGVDRKPWSEVKKLLDETRGIWKDAPEREFYRGGLRRVRKAGEETVRKLRKGIY